VDVFTTRAADGIVRIRGLAKANTNRTLILLNGRWILDGFIESLNWESLPITLEEVDRIEVVGGPAAALYGSNAISGVINIITLTPE
jgi:outer membrane receptor protein involved in Fe transport